MGRQIASMVATATDTDTMRTEEYQLMFNVEDRHYWYAGLRAMLDLHWRRHAGQDIRRMADIGCGTGAVMAMLGAHGWVAGLDVAPEALRFSRQRGLRPICRASACALPWRDASFDAAVMFDVLYHREVREPVLALREARRILRPGGLLFLNVPAYEWMRSSHDDAVQTGRRFTTPGLRALLEESGLESLSTTHWNTLLFPAIAAVRWWRRGSEHGSDLAATPSLEQRAGSAALRIERALLTVTRLPFGLSIFAVARRPGNGH